MRNVRLNREYERIPRDVLATGNDYPAQTVLGRHAHARGQLLYAAIGTFTAITDGGSWVVPPRRALWIAPDVPHEVHMSSTVSTRSVYLRQQAIAVAGLPARCRVIGVSPLLHALLLEAVDVPVEYAADSRGGRLMALLVDEGVVPG